jgi:hypothetical protein
MMSREHIKANPSRFRLVGVAARFFTILVLLCGLLGVCAQATHAADAADKRRVEIGLKIFRATLAADVHLERKRNQEQGLTIVLFFTKDRLAAEGYRRKLAQPGGLLKHPLHLVLSDDPTLNEFHKAPPAAIVVTESRLSPGVLHSLRDFSARHSRLLFSPFEADVERGVAAGLFIGARVEPYVNLPALRASGVELQPFFLGIAKTTD